MDSQSIHMLIIHFFTMQPYQIRRPFCKLQEKQNDLSPAITLHNIDILCLWNQYGQDFFHTRFGKLSICRDMARSNQFTYVKHVITEFVITCYHMLSILPVPPPPPGNNKDKLLSKLLSAQLHNVHCFAVVQQSLISRLKSFMTDLRKSLTSYLILQQTFATLSEQDILYIQIYNQLF